MSVLVPLAICIGFVAGALAAYRLASAFCVFLSTPGVGFKLIAAFATIGALLALLPVGFLSIVAGGQLVAGYLSVVFGIYGVPIGIAVGIALTFAVGVTSCAAVFALAGKVVARVVYGPAAT